MDTEKIPDVKPELQSLIDEASKGYNRSSVPKSPDQVRRMVRFAYQKLFLDVIRANYLARGMEPRHWGQADDDFLEVYDAASEDYYQEANRLNAANVAWETAPYSASEARKRRSNAIFNARGKVQSVCYEITQIEVYLRDIAIPNLNPTDPIPVRDGADLNDPGIQEYIRLNEEARARYVKKTWQPIVDKCRANLDDLNNRKTENLHLVEDITKEEDIKLAARLAELEAVRPGSTDIPKDSDLEDESEHVYDEGKSSMTTKDASYTVDLEKPTPRLDFGDVLIVLPLGERLYKVVAPPGIPEDLAEHADKISFFVSRKGWGRLRWDDVDLSNVPVRIAGVDSGFIYKRGRNKSVAKFTKEQTDSFNLA